MEAQLLGEGAICVTRGLDLREQGMKAAAEPDHLLVPQKTRQPAGIVGDPVLLRAELSRALSPNPDWL